ncbi:hypothetical protein P3875_07235 [Myroides sp. JBRI-B21084]|uniref:hypothetical protein n=1 Tax=Myroides sp. JBRI-B21084 TaxID=3119977 RepID=UPI0026E431AE|nr:hypothetical protein [Paenimyroides cloacae]WKW45578.1 hypothetical protein P3875_07235 [Paenimyroides cloacae]
MKKIFLVVTTCFTCLFAFSQTEYNKGYRLGLGLNAGLLTNDYYDYSLGVDVRLQYDFSQKKSITLTTGYNHFFNEMEDEGMVPVKFGLKYFLGNKFYLMGEAGAAIGVVGDLNNSLLLAPTFGYATKYIDASIRYENYNDYVTDQIALRLAYGFKLNKKK